MGRRLCWGGRVVPQGYRTRGLRHEGALLFAVILLPTTMLGCVYYPWSALHDIRWLQLAVLVNPMVYMSEGMRAVLTPVLDHMPLWGVFLALIGGTVVFGSLGIRTFTRRVLN
jgi:ABC-type polysaccharide/polyol phosphate export permease